MPNSDNVQIAPAEGKLGVLVPGMGAVTTTFIAGLEAIKRGLGKPIGSLTQLGTVRLGKRTEGRSPAIKDFVPLASLDDLECSVAGTFLTTTPMKRLSKRAFWKPRCWTS